MFNLPLDKKQIWKKLFTKQEPSKPLNVIPLSSVIFRGKRWLSMQGSSMMWCSNNIVQRLKNGHNTTFDKNEWHTSIIFQILSVGHPLLLSMECEWLNVEMFDTMSEVLRHQIFVAAKSTSKSTLSSPVWYYLERISWKRR